ncbi:ribosome maturation factor RimP [Waterburya agarophytonicola K14]|uniref:Ribosome maturation factor RimP n=1 Tax=Waterburya agarophytonicola KI4 TaxID=2874699 RepID=A0A964BRB8_9CYAN|nr:ribosome maturation factor RimP [Waterburya agarophytonicola]MCC0177789.1 ribosome maturation factor RimP [Waterburya agarophytonicola KI4]
MTHPIVTQIIELASPLAEDLNLELVDAVFQTNKTPPILRIDVRNPGGDTSLENCEQMSRILEEELDLAEIIPTAYVLEISSPGISRILTSDREFTAFKGFAVRIKTFAPYKNKKEWQGRLQQRDETAIHINQKGKAIAIPRELVAKVQLEDE